MAAAVIPILFVRPNIPNQAEGGGPAKEAFCDGAVSP